MRIDILTLFPGIFKSPLEESLLKKARERGLISIYIHDLRKYTRDKHNTADDTSYGGGPGMVLKPEPIFAAIEAIKSPQAQVILLCPTGEKLTQVKAETLSKEKHLILLCGRYEGIDERVRALLATEISIGDYVLNGGEIPALVLVEAVARMLPGMVGDADSISQDSFKDGLLDWPHYTKPEEFEGRKIPPVLKSGNHAEISRWRRKKSLQNTLFKRPDLLAKAGLSPDDKILLEEIIHE